MQLWGRQCRCACSHTSFATLYIFIAAHAKGRATPANQPLPTIVPSSRLLQCAAPPSAAMSAFGSAPRSPWFEAACIPFHMSPDCRPGRSALEGDQGERGQGQQEGGACAGGGDLAAGAPAHDGRHRRCASGAGSCHSMDTAASPAPSTSPPVTEPVPPAPAPTTSCLAARDAAPLLPACELGVPAQLQDGELPDISAASPAEAWLLPLLAQAQAQAPQQSARRIGNSGGSEAVATGELTEPLLPNDSMQRTGDEGAADEGGRSSGAACAWLGTCMASLFGRSQPLSTAAAAEGCDDTP